MAITFPEGVDGELFYVPDSDLVLKYDESTNSWNIVGPDNLATIDYVDQTIATDKTKTYRNSSLHAETNVLGVNTKKQTVISTGCMNAATSSFSADLKYEPGTNKPLGPDEYNPPEYLIATGNTLPEWHECIGAALPAGTWSYIGHDLVTSNASSEFRYILGISMSKNDKDGEPSKVGPIIPGDKIELYLDQTTRSASEIKFAIYEVIEVFDGANNVTLSVLFRDSDTPTQNVADSTVYELHSYGSSLERTGGDIEGDLKIVNDSTTTFEVYKNEDDIGASNPYNLVFRVNTSDNNVTVSQAYNDDRFLDAGDFELEVDPLSVATVGYVNNRLGLDLEKRFRSDDGPYLKISGGDIGYINILNDGMGGTQNFVVRGIKDDNSVKNEVILASLNNTQNNNKTEVRYYGPIVNELEITTKEYVDKLVEVNKPDLDPYIKVDGTPKVTGTLGYASTSATGYKTNILDYNDKDIPCAKAIKSIKVATVYNGNSTEKGELYEVSGVLYYNTYA